MNCPEQVTQAACVGARRPAFAARWLDWLPLVILPTAAWMVFANAKPWILMWALCFGVFAGCKWLTWREARGTGGLNVRDLAYLFLWPGMDAREFLGLHKRPARLATREWISAAAKTVFGIALLWGVAGRIPASQALPKGWLGMIGMIFVLHFGTFHLLALMWQHFGVDARPLMNAPILAESLGEFWGRRWNTAFNCIARDLVFLPLRHGIGAAAATMAGFLVSGLVHELVISVPARGGYGLPTAYFLLQGAGILFERSRLGRIFNLRRGLAGRCFTIALTALPALWLFHPPFVRNVILPMLQSIGAT